MPEQPGIDLDPAPRVHPREWLVLLAPVLVVYAATLCPTVHWYDSAEFAASAAALAVPHPPGYPLYTIVAHLFTWLPFEPAFSVNLMSLVFAALAVAALHALARGLGLAAPAAWVAGWTLAFAPTMWANAVVAEVYTPGLACSLGVLLVLQRGERVHPSVRPVLLAALLAGAGTGMHLSLATLGLGYALLVLTWGVPARRIADLRRCLAPPWAPRLRAALAGLGGAALGLLVFLYVPWRRLDRWDDLDAWAALADVILGGPFKSFFLDDYTFGARMALVRGILADNLRTVGVVVALLGLAALVRRAPRWALALALAALGNVWWFFNYDVPDLDVFLLPTVAIAALAIAAALQEAASLLARRRRWAHLLVFIGLAWPARSLLANWQRIDMSRATEARDWGEVACDALTPDAMVIHFRQPNEWHRYPVLVYMRDVLGRCPAIQILGRPDAQIVRAALDAGRPVFALAPTRQLSRGYRHHPAGPLIRVDAARP